MVNSFARRQVLELICGAAAGPVPLMASTHATNPDERAGWWPSLARYTVDNERLINSGRKIDCVFIGDSITERWLKLRPDFFKAGWVCRGITGQTTPQMLVRFRADVVALKPNVVHIMAGTNDIAGNTGYATSEMIVDNIRTMTEIAQANSINVVLASVPPAARYPWKPGVRPVQTTRDINAALRRYSLAVDAVYADYYPDLDDGHGGMKPGWSTGDVHPTAIAYATMESIAIKSISLAYHKPKRRLANACVKPS